MPNKIYYLESDEEITKVINRIRQSEEDGVVLVVPRNSTLTQSMINLKLLKRSAIEHKKAIGLVSTDHITKNLAEQLKINIFGKVTEAEKARLGNEVPFVVPSMSQKSDPSLQVHTYRKYDLSKMNNVEEQETEDGRLKTKDNETDNDNIKLSKKPLSEEGATYEPEAKIEDAADDEDNFTEGAEVSNESEELEEERETTKIEEKKDIKSDDEEDMRHSGSYGKGRHIRTGGSRKPLMILFGAIVLILVVVLGLFLPYTQAAVTLKTTDLDKKVTISIDKNQKDFDSVNNVLSGKMIELEKSASKSFNSTGKKDAGAAASGTITISNSVETKAIPVSPGTKVTTADGKVFTVASGVLVPAAVISNPQLINGKLTYDTTPGTIDAKVTASQTGDSYNLAADTKFTIMSMTATNKAAFSGGVTKTIAFVTEDDLAKAEASMKDSALADNKAELLDNATKSSIKIMDKNISVSVISFNTDKKANDEADTFAATSDVKLSAPGFAEADLRAAMVTLTSSQLKNDTMLVNPENSELTYTVSGYSADTNILKLDVEFKAKTGTKMSTDTLKKSLIGKSAASAQKYLLSQNGVASVSLKTTPSFWHQMPFLASRIRINFDYQK